MPLATLMDFTQLRNQVSKKFSSQFSEEFQSADLFYDSENSELNIFCYFDDGYLANQIGKRLKGIKKISGASSIRIHTEKFDWRF